MSRRNWKQRERQAAALIGGRRYPANTGGDVDVENGHLVVQVKERARLSLTDAEALAVHIAEVGRRRFKAGIVMAKRSAGRGKETPWLVIMTADVFREMNGRLPTDPEPAV